MSKAKIEREKGKSLIDFPSSYVVIDLETTGLDPFFDEIIEIGALKVENGIIIDKYQTLVKPENEIDEYVEELTGITNEMLADAPKPETILTDIIDFIGDNVLVGHNVNFDINFLYDYSVGFYNKTVSNDFVDTMRLSKRLLPELAHHRLCDLIKHYSIECNAQHRALEDCYSTYSALNKLKETAISEFGDLDNFYKKYYKKSTSNKCSIISPQTDCFDESHPLYQQHCCFTGTLENFTRKDAQQLVVNLGGICDNSVTKKTNYLILGSNEYNPLVKNGKSNKQKKAEELILKGMDMTILSESAFIDMLNWENDFDISSSNDETDNLNDNDILERIKSFINPEFLTSSKLFIRENKSSYNSYMIEAKQTVYRIGFDARVLFARIKTTGKLHYISFSSTHKKRIDGIFNYNEKNGFLEIDISEFLDKIASSPDAQKALNSIFINSFSFARFGCCARYKECSKEKKCIHPDPIYSNSCEYRHHLETGRIFY